jgi:hypothetical protein
MGFCASLDRNETKKNLVGSVVIGAIIRAYGASGTFVSIYVNSRKYEQGRDVDNRLYELFRPRVISYGQATRTYSMRKNCIDK